MGVGACMLLPVIEDVLEETIYRAAAGKIITSVGSREDIRIREIDVSVVHDQAHSS